MRSRSALLSLLAILVILAGVILFVTASGLGPDGDHVEGAPAVSGSVAQGAGLSGASESRETVGDGEPRIPGANPDAKSRPVSGKATLDIDVKGLPRHDTPWIHIASRSPVATPDGTYHCRVEVATDRPYFVGIVHTWVPTAPRFYFPAQEIATPRLTPGGYGRVEIDFADLVCVRGRLLGRHGGANVLIAAQLELPPTAPGAKPKRLHFSLATNRRGEFTIYGRTKGTLFLFHHSARPCRGVGPKLLDRSGEDSWPVPREGSLDVETAVPLLGIRFLGDGAPTGKTLRMVPGARRRGPLDAAHAIHRPTLEESGLRVLEFDVPGGIGRFRRNWRDLQISGDHELLVPIPTGAELIGLLRIEPATQRGKARLARLPRGGGRVGGWTLEVRPFPGTEIRTLPRSFGPHPWRLEGLRPGYYRLTWKRRLAPTRPDPIAPPAARWQNEIVAASVDLRGGEETVVKLDLPELADVAIRVVNWKDIPPGQRPTHVVASIGTMATVSPDGLASLALPDSLIFLRFEFRREGIGGLVLAGVRSLTNGVELEFPLPVKMHRVRLRPRLGGTALAWVMRLRANQGTGSAVRTVARPDSQGWLRIYTPQAGPLVAWFLEVVDRPDGRRIVALRGSKRVFGKPVDTQYDPGGRVLKVELAPGTTQASIEMRFENLGITAPRRVWLRREVRGNDELWLPEGVQRIRLTVGTQAPRLIPVAKLVSPFLIRR